jgi:hypothetical protein
MSTIIQYLTINSKASKKDCKTVIIDFDINVTFNIFFWRRRRVNYEYGCVYAARAGTGGGAGCCGDRKSVV